MQASGSGRRARAPSRKLLEASGALEHEGAQWMTREIKEADAKVKKEIREQRKHFKVAGLKAEEVIEAFTATQAGGDDSTADTGIDEGKFGSKDRGSRSGSGLSDRQCLCAQVPAKHQKQQRQWSTGEGSAASANTSAKKEALFLATGEKLPLKRAWVVSVPDGSAREGKSAMAEGDATAPTPKRSKEGRDCHNREDGKGAVSEASGNFSAVKQKIAAGRGESKGFSTAGEGRGGSVYQSKCEFGDCSKTASFGVNGTVRYW